MGDRGIEKAGMEDITVEVASMVVTGWIVAFLPSVNVNFWEL